MPHRRRSGFTLIELMIAVCIIGVLASVAIPVFQSFIMNAKSAEGMQSLGLQYRGAAAYWEREFAGKGAGATGHTHCTIGEVTADWSSLRPPMPPTPEKRTYDFTQHQTYRDLGFAPTDPLYFIYGLDNNYNNQWGGGLGDDTFFMCEPPSDGLLYVFYALSDLDGDGVWGGYSLAAGSRGDSLYKSIGIVAGVQGTDSTLDPLAICAFCKPGPE
jgi:prepilin-type N-terminal cleavage/methylation domain-containing protein